MKWSSGGNFWGGGKMAKMERANARRVDFVVTEVSQTFRAWADY